MPLLRLGRLSRMFYKFLRDLFIILSQFLAGMKFCGNVEGVPRPFDQLQSCVGKVNTFETPEMHLYFDLDVLDRRLTIIFAGSFPYFKFLTKINSKLKRK